MAKATPQPVLPKRYKPYVAQANTEADLRYGGQEAAFGSLFGSTRHDYQQQSAAQGAATRSLLGALAAAPADLNRVYSEAGLSPSVLAGISNSPTGQRLAGELARSQAGIQTQATGAQAGGIYQQQHLFDQYRQDVGKINDQVTAERHERGVFTSSLLDQLIGSDKAARAAAKQHLADQQFTADQNALKNSQTEANALIGAGVDPNTGAVLPGHGPKPKAKPQATRGEQAQAESAFSLALTSAKAAVEGQRPSKALINDVIDQLVNGIPATKAKPGKTVYEDVPVKDQFGNVTGTKRQPKLDPKTHTEITTGGDEGSPAIAPVNPAIAHAAVEMATQGYLSPKTVKELHRLGYAVQGFPGVRTWRHKPKPVVGNQGSRPGATPYYGPNAGH